MDNAYWRKKGSNCCSTRNLYLKTTGCICLIWTEERNGKTPAFQCGSIEFAPRILPFRIFVDFKDYVSTIGVFNFVQLIIRLERVAQNSRIVLFVWHL